MIHGYGKIYNLGHAAIKELLDDEVQVEEKVDGSQFSFGVFNGELKCRSHHNDLIVDEPDKMFSKAVDTAKELAPILRDGWTYRGEYLQKPKHNTLAYDRVPEKNIVLFDIDTAEQDYMSYGDKIDEAQRLGLEVVPSMGMRKITDFDELQYLLENSSFLGGQSIEGVVLKNYNRFGRDGKALMGKFVSEKFKEKHKRDWKVKNPAQSDIKLLIGNSLRTEARWEKGVQHLKEKGLLTNSPKDIGALMREVPEDLKAECIDEVKDQLFRWAWPDIVRIATRGLPQWYKETLAREQFTTEEKS